VQLYLGTGIQPLTMIMVAALALFTYALNGLSDEAEDNYNDRARAAALRRSSWWTVGGSVTAMAVAGGLLASRDRFHPLYPLLMAVGVAYSFRIIPRPRRSGFEWLRLKDVLLVKNLTIGATWASAVFIGPWLDLTRPVAAPVTVIIVAVGYALLVVVNSIFCDLRDEAGDRLASVYTVAVRFGGEGCYRAIFVAMSLWSAVLMTFFALNHLDGRHLVFLATSALGYPLAVWFSTRRFDLRQGHVNCVIESSDFFFALGLMALSI
jgi:4-hydroxybenzoate polyprenyltransferase